MVVIIPSESDVVRFTNATGDDQRLHNPGFMKTAGKQGSALEAIVPGLQVLFYELANLKEVNNIRSFQAYFSSPVNVDDIVEFDSLNNEEGIYLIASNQGKQVFTPLSSASPNSIDSLVDQPIIGELEVSSMPFNEKDAHEISELFGVREDVGNFFYALGCTSKVLLDRVRDNESLSEKAFGKNNDSLPMYTGIRLSAHNGLGIDGMPDSLDYNFSLIYSEKKEFSVYVNCEYVNCEGMNNKIFSAVFGFKSVPERMILRFAKKKMLDDNIIR